MDVNVELSGSGQPGSGRPGSEGPGSDPQSAAHTGGSVVADPAVGRLAAAVDDLTNLRSQPVEAHAGRYREVHNVLQDALSDTDRGGPQPS